jgi:hypothetical protein
MALVRIAIVFAALAAGLHCPAQASGHPDKYRPGPVKAVELTRSQPQDASGDATKCKGIRPLREKDVRYFLKRAKPTTQRGFSHDYFMLGDCSTEANVRFKDGRTANILITNDTGTAIITPVMKGAHSEQLYYFVCEKCSGMLDLPDRTATN